VLLAGKTGYTRTRGRRTRTGPDPWDIYPTRPVGPYPRVGSMSHGSGLVPLWVSVITGIPAGFYG